MRTFSLDSFYHGVSAAFCTIVVVSNIISAKMVSLPFSSDLFLPAGLLTYPLTFLLSDLVTEIFGAKKAKEMVYIAFGANFLSFAIIALAIALPVSPGEEALAFQLVLGLSGLRIFASVAAYSAAQLIDIQLYALIKRWTGARWLWLRNNGSTCISQAVDTLFVDVIYLWWGLNMGWDKVVVIMALSYAYKAFFTVLNTPLFYACVYGARAMLQLPETSSIDKEPQDKLATLT